MQQPEYVAKHNKIWKHKATGKTYSDKITLQADEKLTDYQQIPKPQEKPSKHRAKQVDKPVFSFEETENKEEFNL